MQKAAVITKQDSFSTITQNYSQLLYSQSTYDYVVSDLELAGIMCHWIVFMCLDLQVMKCKLYVEP